MQEQVLEGKSQVGAPRWGLTACDWCRPGETPDGCSEGSSGLPEAGTGEGAGAEPALGLLETPAAVLTCVCSPRPCAQPGAGKEVVWKGGEGRGGEERGRGLGTGPVIEMGRRGVGLLGGSQS